MSNSLILSPEEIHGIPVLLRIIMATKNFDGPEMRQYLLSKHKIDFTGNSETKKNNNFNRTCSGTRGEGLMKTKLVAEWKKFYKIEESCYLGNLKSALYGKYEKSFSQPNKFNWDSVYDLIDKTYTAESIIFFNTYIDLEEWFDPIIQMHLCIQKSIEQKINFFRVQECHKNYKEKSQSKSVGACNKNPPVYRQYRIMFIRKTKNELKALIEEKGREYEMLSYVAYMHTSLSIQLAIFTLDDWGELIDNNREFFTQKKNLQALKLNEDLSEIISENFNYPLIYESIKSSIEAQRFIPDENVSEGLDMLCALNVNHISMTEEESQTYDEIWASFYNKDLEGLNYYKLENEEYAKIKVEFTKMLFSQITEDITASKAKHKKLDPIYTFYVNNKKFFKAFTNQHDASLILNLEK